MSELALMNWWFQGLGGLGGWWLFALLAFASVLYVWMDSQSRHKSAIEWKLGVLIPALLLLPTLIFYFGPAETKLALANGTELIFLIGLVGGIMPLGVAIAYWISGPPSWEEGPAQPDPGRVAEGEQLGKRYGSVGGQPAGGNISSSYGKGSQPLPAKAQGWLVCLSTGREYSLYRGETTIGRSKDNLIVFADPTVSREQAVIREEKNVFTLYDRASKFGTFLNGKRLDAPAILHPDDEVMFGEQRVRFVGTR